MEADYLTRVVFGPRPGREWLSIDFQSIEFFIWGFICGNTEIRYCYEQGISPFKPILEAVWGFFDKGEDNPIIKQKYKRTKNGIYSILYGAGEAHSDTTFGRIGAVKAVIERLPEVKTFTKHLHKLLKQKGYIETLGGYRLYVSAAEPHKATSAFVQGHAGWVIGQAMIKCYEYLRDFQDINILLQIHDELIFDGPIGFADIHANPLSLLMQEAGEQYGIPTPTSRSKIVHNWGEPQEMAV
jgi:DNA polymerase-1